MNFDRKLCSRGPRNMKVVFVVGVSLVKILNQVVTQMHGKEYRISAETILF